jgi:hypothetical protein
MTSKKRRILVGTAFALITIAGLIIDQFDKARSCDQSLGALRGTLNRMKDDDENVSRVALKDYMELAKEIRRDCPKEKQRLF